VTTATSCAECHTHGNGDGPSAYVDSDAGLLFIAHEGQADEMALGGHASLECTACHDPHSGVRKESPAGSGIVRACESCHAEEAAIVRHPGGVTPLCTDCHMPQATYSTVAANEHRADVRTHIFSLRRTAETKEAMFENARVRAGGVTLDFACYRCHSDPDGVGGDAPSLSIEQLAGWAPNVHSAQSVARGEEGRP
jgi:hypothetical protein